MKIDKSKVQKALAPEEKQMIGDIRSLLDKLEAEEQAEPEEGAEGGEGGEEEEDDLFSAAMKAANAMGIDGQPEDEGNKVNKATASDKADARVDEDEPDEGKKALALIGKALGLVVPEQKVQKSATLQALEGITQVVGKLAARVDEQNRAFGTLVEGMGLGEVFKSEAAAPVRQAPSLRGVQQNAAIDMLAQAILKAAGSDGAAHGQEPNTSGDRSSLGDAMRAIAAE